MNRTIPAFAAVILLATVAARAQALEPGELIGPIELTRLDGSKLVMSNYDERPATAVLFLSARCDVTADAIAAINELYRKYRLRDALYVGVCANPAEEADELRTFAQRRGVIFPLYRDPESRTARRLGAQVTPEVFLLDRRGALVFHGGLATQQALSEFESAILGLLRNQPIEAASRVAQGTPIDRPGAKRKLDDPFGPLSFSSELIFERIPFAPAHHCSTICETADGELLCLWYGGSYESADDQALFLSRRPAGRRAWSPPEALIRNSDQPPGNAVIFRDAADRIWVVWGRMESSRPLRRGSGWGRCRLMYRISQDNGRTWSGDRPVFDETIWALPRNPPIALSDGNLLLPVTGHGNESSGPLFLTLQPNSTQWQPAGFGSGGSQPALIERSDGSLLALLRRSGYIHKIESTDGGKTWLAPEPTQLKNPGAGISMARLANGHVVLVFNNSQRSRTPLSIARSLDDGRMWEEPLDLESNPGEYSYPCVIQTADGKIHVTYTFRRYAIKHVELNEDWLVHLRRPN